jgi:hypothetical protein
MNKINFLFNYFTKEDYEKRRKGTRFQNPLKINNYFSHWLGGS